MAFATVQFFSRSLQKATSANVVFPDDPDVPRPWGVFYLLHGMSDDHSIWMRRSSIERYAQGLPMVVVMPDGGRGWYVNSAGVGAHEDDLLVDTVGMIERTFPVRAERSGRAIGGLSMGGYGAVKIALKYPDRFASATSHSGAMAAAREPEIPRQFSPEYDRVFSPDSAGGDEDPFGLIERIDPSRAPALRLDCGVEDFLIDQNRTFHRHATEHGIAHEYQEYEGGHDWAYWDAHVREAVAFHARHLGLAQDGG